MNRVLQINKPQQINQAIINQQAHKWTKHLEINQAATNQQRLQNILAHFKDLAQQIDQVNTSPRQMNQTPINKRSC